jgi:hypothetical protein
MVSANNELAHANQLRVYCVASSLKKDSCINPVFAADNFSTCRHVATSEAFVEVKMRIMMDMGQTAKQNRDI